MADVQTELEQPAAAATSAAPPQVGDAPTLDEAVQCPLCDYDLRGQTEPRCPECGYRFEWADLTDPARRLHPYLFEHHPRHNTWSFFRTLLGGLRPARFWSSLKPSQPSRPGRLVLYWVLASIVLPLGYAGVFVYTCVSYAPEHEMKRAQMLTWANRMMLTGNPVGSWTPEIGRAGGPQGFVDSQYPPPGSLAYLGFVFETRYAPTFRKHLEIVGLYLAWPWATLAALLIFRASMRRAKVRSVHVLRCALYCCDAGIWLAVAAAMAVPPLVNYLDLGRYIGYEDRAVAAIPFAIMTGWRLSAAYRHYLQFDRPAATAAAAQFIVLLVVWVYLYTGDPV